MLITTGCSFKYPVYTLLIMQLTQCWNEIAFYYKMHTILAGISVLELLHLMCIGCRYIPKFEFWKQMCSLYAATPKKLFYFYVGATWKKQTLNEAFGLILYVFDIGSIQCKVPILPHKLVPYKFKFTAGSSCILDCYIVCMTSKVQQPFASVCNNLPKHLLSFWNAVILYYYKASTFL